MYLAHDLKNYDVDTLLTRMEELQTGPLDLVEARGFYCEHEDCPWNSRNSVENELVHRIGGTGR